MPLYAKACGSSKHIFPQLQTNLARTSSKLALKSVPVCALCKTQPIVEVTKRNATLSLYRLRATCPGPTGLCIAARHRSHFGLSRCTECCYVLKSVGCSGNRVMIRTGKLVGSKILSSKRSDVNRQNSYRKLIRDLLSLQSKDILNIFPFIVTVICQQKNFMIKLV